MKCFSCGREYEIETDLVLDDSIQSCEACALEATKNNAYQLVTSRLLVCIQYGRHCDNCDRDCALNEDRSKIQRHGQASQNT